MDNKSQWIDKFNRGLEKLNEIIINKKFETSKTVGYDPEEVDVFFDQVIEYINEVKEQVDSIYRNNYNLKEQLQFAEAKLKALTEEITILRKDKEYLEGEGYGSLKNRNDINRIDQENKELREALKELVKQKDVK
ncbi:MAG: DivIVA domain-containing protein [Mycoplasmataceae bacterium]|nr:DivIVA domain-containing protein [Mycoplasmataceae bacterium]